ncbi:AbrB/MazE/SpoVT family DNA-binding domain-containing protein [Maricaulaceae bacterium MS644]
MKALIGKWGRSAALRLPKPYLEALGIKAGDEVEVTLEGKTLVVAAGARPSLEDLVAQMKTQQPPEVVDWGPDVGAEVIRD